MDIEYSVILLTLCVLLLAIWPNLIRSFSQWKNAALRRDNPHLNRCYYIRMWGTPVFVILASVISTFLIKPVPEHDLIDKTIISLLILFLTIFIGTLLSEFVVDHYRKHESHFS